ncbi:hypothetical protein IE077_001863 [Cardiosporidium cionae]|uniref:RAP domain-containing protein n=1 Tax=Cardiosporidium cionae TaxID=476202 RepID=A0ABQ7JC24_9APIC|nr:hypothetical protein IE077_001863 [Cardiosporidium cionae]|eukprot:KAF8821567.1 hypothetical protein IE077_001863 [Cardiosporidium cionae]
MKVCSSANGKIEDRLEGETWFKKPTLYHDAIQALSTPEDCYSFFIENRSRLKATERIQLIDRLGSTILSAGILYKSSIILPSDERGSREVAHRPRRLAHPLLSQSEFLLLLQDSIRQLDLLSGEEIVGLSSAIARLQLPDRAALRTMEPHILRHLPSLSYKYVAHIAFVFIHQHAASSLLCDALCAYTLQLAPLMDVQTLASLCESFAKAPFKPSKFLAGILPQIQKNVENFNTKQLSLLLYAFTKWERSSSPEWRNILSNQILKKIQSNELGSISSRLRILGVTPHLSKAGKSLLLSLEDISLLDARSISTVVWAYSALDVGGITLFKKLKERALEMYTQMSHQGFSNCLYGFAKTLGCTLDDEGDVDLEFLKITEEYLLSVLPAFTPKDLTKTASAYAVGRCGSAAFHAALQIACIQHTGKFSGEELAKIIYAFGYSRGGHKIFSVLQLDLLEHLHLLSLPALCDVCWSYAVAQFKDSQFWETLLSLIPPSKILGDDRCALLYPALMELKHLNSDSNHFNLLSRLKSNSKDAFWNLQLFDFPESFVEEISIALRHRSVPPSKLLPCYDYQGFLVDLWMIIEDIPYVILCHTSLTLHKDLNKPLGGTMLKHRFLNREDIPIVHLPWHFWKECKTSQAKINLLDEAILMAISKRNRKITRSNEDKNEYVGC